MDEPLPLYRVHEAIFEFCRGYEDAVIFGAQAVNIYTNEPRMTGDVDILSENPDACAAALAHTLREKLFLAVRVRRMLTALRVYQIGPRHLADIRPMPVGVQAVEKGGVRFVPLPLLVAMKVIAFVARGGRPKGKTDHADLQRLLLANRSLLEESGGQAVATWIWKLGGNAAHVELWHSIRTTPIAGDDDGDY